MREWKLDSVEYLVVVGEAANDLAYAAELETSSRETSAVLSSIVYAKVAAFGWREVAQMFRARQGGDPQDNLHDARLTERYGKEADKLANKLSRELRFRLPDTRLTRIYIKRTWIVFRNIYAEARDHHLVWALVAWGMAKSNLADIPRGELPLCLREFTPKEMRELARRPLKPCSWEEEKKVMLESAERQLAYVRNRVTEIAIKADRSPHQLFGDTSLGRSIDICSGHIYSLVLEYRLALEKRPERLDNAYTEHADRLAALLEQNAPA